MRRGKKKIRIYFGSFPHQFSHFPPLCTFCSSNLSFPEMPSNPSTKLININSDGLGRGEERRDYPDLFQLTLPQTATKQLRREQPDGNAMWF